MAHPTQVLVARNRCKPSCDGKKITSHGITFFWNVGNNEPIYFNTLVRFLPRLGINLGFNGKSLTDPNAGIGYNIGLAVQSAACLIFLYSNQVAYSDKVYKALFSEQYHQTRHTQQRSSNCDGFILVVSTLTKTEANMITMADFVSSCFKYPSIANTATTVTFTAVSFLANLLANTAFYSSRVGTTLPMAQRYRPETKNAWRHLSNTIYSIACGIFYMMSLVNFREHLKLVDKPDLGFSDIIEGSITILSAYSGLVIAVATHAKYNVYIGKYLGETKTQYSLPQCYRTFAESNTITILAAISKALISATSCFALVFQLVSGNLPGAFVAAGAPILFTALVQWALLKKESVMQADQQRLIEEADINAIGREEREEPQQDNNCLSAWFWWLCCCNSKPAGNTTPQQDPSPGLSARFWRCLGYTDEAQTNGGITRQDVETEAHTSSWPNFFPFNICPHEASRDTNHCGISNA